MRQKEIHECQCDACRLGTVEQIQAEHGRLNLLMSRLDELQPLEPASLSKRPCRECV